MPKFDPLTVECPQCGAKAGDTCTNCKGQKCAPHRARKIKSPEKRERHKTWTQLSFVQEDQ